MRRDQVLDRLNDAGFVCFIRHYERFAGDTPRREVAEYISALEGYTIKAATARAKDARAIIRQGWADLALGYIEDSTRLNESLIRKAKRLRRELKGARGEELADP